MVLAMPVSLAHGAGQIHTCQPHPRGGNPNPLGRAARPRGRLPSPLAGETGRWEPGSMSDTNLEEIDMSAKSTAPLPLAARAGRWSAQHRKKAIWGWLAFALVAFMLGGALGTKTQTNAQSGVGESGQAARTIDNAFPKHQVEQVLVQSNHATAHDPSFAAVVASVQRHLAAVPYTRAFESPYTPGNAGQISADGHSALLRFEITGDETQAAKRVGATLKATAAVQAAS